MRLLFLGDVVGKPGRRLVRHALPELRETLALDLVIANAENASGGLGVTPKSAQNLLNSGVDMLTSGNHVWRYKDIYSYLEQETRMLRPGNYPEGAPGAGARVYTTAGGVKYAVLNLLGRTYMQPVDCPFKMADTLLAELPEDVKIRIVDFHAEATSEKIALAYYLDGKVSAVVGTHTHVQTNDARVLENGAAAITDVGMCGIMHSILGMDVDIIVDKFVNGLPKRFDLAKKGPTALHGALMDFDETTGRALRCETFTHWEDI